MRMSEWAKWLTQNERFSQILTSPELPAEWGNVAPDARPLLVASLFKKNPRPLLLIVSSHEKALIWQAKLQLCGIPDSRIRQLPSGLSALFEDASPESVALSDRIGALRFLVGDVPGIVITTPQAALERTLPRDLLESAFFEVRVNDTVDMDSIIDSLKRLGYDPAEPVRVPGQYSRRGGILDVFAMGMEQPIRIEFFDDLVESMRIFDPNSQRSISKIEELVLAPSREVIYPAETDLQAFMSMIQRTLEQECAGLDEETASRLNLLVDSDISALSQRVYFDRLELYRPLLHPDSGCAIDLLGENGIVMLDDPFELEPIAARAEEDLSEALTARSERGEILTATANDYLYSPQKMANGPNWIALTAIGAIPSWMGHPKIVEIEGLSTSPYRSQAAYLVQSIKNWIEAEYRVFFATDQPTRAKAMLDQVELFANEIKQDTTPDAPGLYMVTGNIAGGALFPQDKVCLLTDMELFGVGRLKLPQRKFNEGAPITTVLDLKEGDFVVHINFGIGIFRGLVKRSVAGVEKEFLFIEYATPDKLYVPADQLDRIQKYLNPGDANPKLNRLTGGEWQKTVKKAREEAREFARDLTSLYAERKTVQRIPFGPDSPWQGEMEATFPYVETPSQMRAINDVKLDLKQDFPMDRLVCGDVGFGKTEVAIRAAFKVAQAGKQVAILCPTTILSEQHFRNFEERLGAFPIKLELINRFRTTSERREALAGLEDGSVDIVLGTHALLNSEIKFKDLGLVIIDEEQKFGVKHKEQLKKLRVSVDILTLSATPIPRTLSMALMDIRQMSLITDPPPGRLPVRTFVRPYSKEVVREAVLRELARGGQVYYVYNRVQGIYHIADEIQKLAPNAKIVVGHGQMHEKELEPVMLAFIRGEADILISTTIVESGLDIPNANTLVVEEADRMGLAQLYQLRGRVGRSDRQAYAYLLHENNKVLSENAVGRLQALQEFSALGSGYSLAFRDLQIRGAGDLLGAKQHGTMATVGYDLFMQLIAEEVKFLKHHADGETGKASYKDPLDGLEPLPPLDLPTKAFIPESYIPDQTQRLYYYQAMMSRRTPEKLAEVEQEITDRYGKMPDEAKRALWIMRLRMRAHKLKIDKMDGASGRLVVHWRPNVDHNPRLWNLLQRIQKDCSHNRGVLTWPYTGGPLAACDRMIEAIETVTADLDAQLASIGHART